MNGSSGIRMPLAPPLRRLWCRNITVYYDYNTYNYYLPHYLLLPLLTQAFAAEIIQMGKTIKDFTAPCNSLSATQVAAKSFIC